MTQYLRSNPSPPPRPTLPPDARHVRAHDSGKTSLLLHYAHSRASSTGGTVLFVCRRDKVEASPPVLPLGIAVDDAALGRVHMRCATQAQAIWRSISRSPWRPMQG